MKMAENLLDFIQGHKYEWQFRQTTSEKSSNPPKKTAFAGQRKLKQNPRSAQVKKEGGEKVKLIKILRKIAFADAQSKKESKKLCSFSAF